MPTLKLFRFSFLILILFTSCSLDDDSDEIIVYEERDFEIALLGVNDYRCPSDVLCVWGGNAEVHLRLRKDGQSEDFYLNTAGYINAELNFPRVATIMDLEIELMSLNPERVTFEEYTLERYEINLEVR